MTEQDRALCEEHIAAMQKYIADLEGNTQPAMPGKEEAHAHFGKLALDNERARLADALANPEATVAKIQEHVGRIDAAFAAFDAWAAGESF